MRLIINADDFGMNKMITEAIDEAMVKGLISETTAVANGEYTNEAIALAIDHGYSDRVGIHCCLTEGRALTPKISKIASICSDGEFTGVFGTRMKFSSEESLAIVMEIREQINVIETLLNHPASHLDSHHHIHMQINLAPLFHNVIGSYAYYRIRNYRNLKQYVDVQSKVKDYAKSLYFKSLFRKYTYSDYMGSIDEMLASKRSISNDDTVEIMVHPQYNRMGVIIDRTIYDEEQEDGELSQQILRLRDLVGAKKLFSVREV